MIARKQEMDYMVFSRLFSVKSEDCCPQISRFLFIPMEGVPPVMAVPMSRSFTLYGKGAVYVR